ATLAQSHVVFTSTALVSVAFQNDASAIAFQVFGVNVQSAHGFRLQVRDGVFEVESSDGGQTSCFPQAAVQTVAVGVGVVAGVRINRASTRVVAALGRTTNSNCHGQSQSGELTKFKHFHNELLVNPSVVRKQSFFPYRISSGKATRMVPESHLVLLVWEVL